MHTVTKDQADKSPDLQPDVRTITAMIDAVIEAAKTERVTFRTVLNAVGQHSFAPILLLPALAVATPLSGIPFFSSVMGLVICLISAQMLVRRDHLWLPEWVLRRDVKGAVVTTAFTKVYPVARWLDARTRSRFRMLVHRPLVFVPQLVCMVSGAMMPFLEFVPFSSSIVGIGVALLALGMLARDGVMIMIGLVPYAAASWIIATAISA